MSRNKAFIIAGVMLVAAVVAGWIITRQFVSVEQLREVPLIELKDSDKSMPLPSSGPDSSIAVKIYLPDFAGSGSSADHSVEAYQVSGLTIIEAMVKSDFSPLKITEAALQEFIKAIGKGFSEARVLTIFRDRSNIVYVDMSPEFLKGFNMDAQNEYNLMRAFYRTAAASSGAEDVKVLIAGKEIESFGGHFFGSYPLKETFGL
ncbi:MAG: GerMN domain-containing protein [Nitrospirae bacterium]|nr:GerMN domain-containing protein [Nitrospirota bacterium]